MLSDKEYITALEATVQNLSLKIQELTDKLYRPTSSIDDIKKIGIEFGVNYYYFSCSTKNLYRLCPLNVSPINYFEPSYGYEFTFRVSQTITTQLNGPGQNRCFKRSKVLTVDETIKSLCRKLKNKNLSQAQREAYEYQLKYVKAAGLTFGEAKDLEYKIREGAIIL